MNLKFNNKGTSLMVMPFAMIIDMVKTDVPIVLINK